MSDAAQRQFELFREDYRLVERLSPRARHVRVEIRSAGEVLLVYPRRVPRAQALAFLREREAWVLEKLQALRRQQAERGMPALRWDGSDHVLLHGQRLPLQLAPASLARAQLRIEAQGLTLFASPSQLADPRRLEPVLRLGLLGQARSDARRLLEEEAARLGVRYAALRVNDPRTQWGSCNPSGTICLSWRLVLAPPPVFRYVAVHELCHLVHRNHSRRFWALVERQMPGYEPQRHWLREHGGGLQDWLPRAQ